MALYAFDGSWKDSNVDARHEQTNVHHFKELYGDSQEHNSWYWHGVGKRRGRIGKYLGGLFGVGAETRLKEALKRVAEAFTAGDEIIDVVGFSRGAATAAAFAWALHRWGVRKSKPGRFDFGTANYRVGELIVASPAIRFMGLFDMVFSTESLLGSMPFWEYQRTKGDNLPFVPRRDFKLPDNVRSAFHAMAIHERTAGFEVTRIGNAFEAWFPGVHGDIGGGGRDRGITDTTLRWMVSKAQSIGVPVDSSKVPEHSSGLLPDDVKNDGERLRRIIRPGDRLFESAFALPLDIGFEQMIQERW